MIITSNSFAKFNTLYLFSFDCKKIMNATCMKWLFWFFITFAYGSQCKSLTRVTIPTISRLSHNILLLTKPSELQPHSLFSKYVGKDHYRLVLRTNNFSWTLNEHKFPKLLEFVTRCAEMWYALDTMEFLYKFAGIWFLNQTTSNP